jgi:flagellar hook-associated protein 2
MSTLGSVSPTSAAWVDQLIQQTMAFERQPLVNLETKRDTLNIRNSIYNDITTKIETLQSSIESLVGTTYGLTNSFNTKSVSVVNDDPDVDVVNVSTSGSSAVPGTYDLTVTQLAQSHQIGSERQAHSDVALGYSGTFVIGGASARSLTFIDTGTNNPVSGFAVNAAADAVYEGETQLGTGNYYIELRQNDASEWQFRVVDENGDAVRVDNVTDAGTETTSNWQSYSSVKDSTFDTGRGLKITFADADPIEQQLFGDIDIASVGYEAQGISITVDSTDSLNDIRTAINDATFAEGNEVQATVVDNRLVLTGQRTGDTADIALSETAGTVLQELGILDAWGFVFNELRPAQNVKFNINGITGIERTKNTGLTDVVQGLSFDIKEEGSATVTVAKDDDTVVEDVKTLIDNVNDVMKYLKAKTEATVSNDDEDGNPTYTAAPLGSDWNMRWLRTEMASDLLGEYSGALGDAPSYLYQLGITLDDDGLFTLEDESALTDALSDDFGAVQDLFSDLFGTLDDRLDHYVDGTDSIISYTQDGLDSEIDDLDDRIDSYEKRLEIRQEALRTQYSAVQSMLISMTYEYQSFQAFSGSMYNQQY